MKAIPCKIVFDTQWGHTTQPIECKSISEALRLAKDTGEIYRIFSKDGKLLRRGWYMENIYISMVTGRRWKSGD